MNAIRPLAVFIPPPEFAGVDPASAAFTISGGPLALLRDPLRDLRMVTGGGGDFALPTPPFDPRYWAGAPVQLVGTTAAPVPAPAAPATPSVNSPPPPGDPGDPLGTVKHLPRGGIVVKTSMGWIQFGVPMWTNKDAFSLFLAANGFTLPKEAIPHTIPTVYIDDPEYSGHLNGLLPFDFLGYMFFVTKGTTFTLVANDPNRAAALKSYLDLSYQGQRTPDLNERVRREYPTPDAPEVPNLSAELEGAFPSPPPDVLRKVTSFDDSGVLRIGAIEIKRLGDQRYEIFDQGTLLTTIDLKTHPLPAPNLERRMEASFDEDFQRIRFEALVEGRPGAWPIGTAHGFAVKEETSGFMVWNHGKVVLVDPPSSTLEYLYSNGIPLDLVEGVIISHGHSDHYGNAIPQLLEALPRIKIYSTRTIYEMLREQYRLALGRPGLEEWNLEEIRPLVRTEINGLTFEFDYSLHPVPTLGFEIWKDDHLVLYFTGDTFADMSIMTKTVPGPNGETPIMTQERAQRILRHYSHMIRFQGQRPAPIFLIEGGIPPIHIKPEVTAAYLGFLKASGIDTSGVRIYHIADAVAETAGVPKWKAGHQGWIDLSPHYEGKWQKREPYEAFLQALRRSPILEGLTDEDLDQLLFDIETGRLEQPGEELFPEGDSESFCILVDGAVNVMIEGRRVTQIQSGLVGEGALLGLGRNATVVAAVPTTYIRFSASRARPFLESKGVLKKLEHIRRVREAAHEAFNRSPWGSLPFEVRTSLFGIGQIEEYQAGTEFIRQGDTTNKDVFVLLEGTTEIIKDETRIAEQGVGTMVGEMALVRNIPRTASVQAKTDIKILRFPADRLQALQDRYPGIGAALLRLMTERERRNGK